MQTKKALKELYGENHEGFGSRLAEVADKLVAAHEAREAERMDRAEVMDRLAGQGPLIEQAARELEKARKEAMANSNAPVISTFEAYCIMRDASKLDASDRVLKTATHALYTKWNSEPFGVLTLGDLTSMREQYSDMAPSSAVRDIIEKDIVERSGFHTLANIGELSHAADLIRDQAGYEDAVEALGIGGDSLKDISARSYLRYEAERRIASRINDEPYEVKAPTMKDALNKVVARVAQQMHEHEEPVSEGQMVGPGGETLEIDEMEMPHDEASEEMAYVDSPVTGDKLVLELGLASGQGVEGMDVEPSMGDASEMGGTLPDMGGGESSFRSVASRLLARHKKVFARLAQVDESGMSDSEMGLETGNNSLGDLQEEMVEGEDAPQGFSEDGEVEETTTEAVDPSSGETVEVVLRRKKAPPAGSEGMSVGPDSEGMMAPDELVGDGRDNAPMDSVSDQRVASRRRRAEMPVPAVRGQPGDAVPSLKPERAFGVKLDKGKKKKKQALTASLVSHICAEEGVGLSTIEDRVLSGDAVFGGRELSAGVKEWGIGMDDTDNIAIVRYKSDGEIDRVVRVAGISEFDDAARDFQARVAASIVADEPENMIVVASMPKKDVLTARRMMAQIWRVVPEAVGDAKDGQLIVNLPKVAEREVNIVLRTLRDVFGVKRVTAQTVPASGTTVTNVGPASMPPAPSMPTMPAGSANPAMAGYEAEEQQAMMEAAESMEMSAEGPYQGEAPIEKRPAGAAMKPMKAPQQTASTGSGAQAEFMKQHNDPMKPHALKAYRKAQLMDEPMPEGMGGGQVREPAPPLDMTPSGGGLGAPMGMPGGGFGGPGLMMTPDASQTPIDFGGGELAEEDEDATRAAIQHFRNIGLLPLETVSKFLTTYGSMLDKYGDESSPQRALAEAAVIRIMGEAYQKPAIIKKKRSAGLRRAEMPVHKHRVQQPDAVKLKMNFDEGEMPKFKVEKPKAPKGKYPDKRMTGHGDSSTHGFGPGKPGGPQAGSQHKNRGVKHPSTSLGKDNSSGSTAFDKLMESLSRSAPEGTRSKLQRGKKSAKVVRAESEDERLEYAEEFVMKLREEGLASPQLREFRRWMSKELQRLGEEFQMLEAESGPEADSYLRAKESGLLEENLQNYVLSYLNEYLLDGFSDILDPEDRDKVMGPTLLDQIDTLVGEAVHGNPEDLSDWDHYLRSQNWAMTTEK